MTDDQISRRTFVGAAAAAGAFTIVPRHVLGGRGYIAPSDKLNVACIGIGGMGGNDVKGMSIENIYALCDVDEENGADSFRSFPKAKKYKDYREMFDKEAKNIDAVTVSTPDHSHASATLMSLRAGKPTYCQKPLCHTIGEVRKVMEVAAASKVATQMGNQGHSHDGTRQIRELVEAGWIGPVEEVHYWTNRPIWPQGMDRPEQAYNVPPTLDWDLWLGPAKERPYNPAYAPFRWRGWWDFGCGALGDIAPHAMDAAFWTLGFGYPSHIAVESTKVYPETAPTLSRLVYDFPAKGSRGPVKVIWRDGNLDEPRPANLPPDMEWPWGDPGYQLWIGRDGMLIADVYGDSVRLLDPKKQAEFEHNPPAKKYPRTEGVYKEWIKAIKTGTQPGSNFPGHAGPLTEMLLLGNLAVRLQQDIDLDLKTGNVTNVPVPEEWITPVYRDGWSWR